MYQLLKDSFKVVKELNRKIRIANSSESSWLLVKNYESDAIALDLEDYNRIRAGEKETL